MSQSAQLQNSASLTEGEQAPGFTNIPADDGNSYSLSDFAGKRVVLYFYPKDDTPGCTTESIAFTEHRAAFEDLNTVILGVSKDSVAKHCKFRDKHQLGIRLLSDEESDLCEQYGTWVEKNMYGKKYMGIERSTFLIDEQGIIRGIWRKVKVNGHVEAVLGAVKQL